MYMDDIAVRASTVHEMVHVLKEIEKVVNMVGLHQDKLEVCHWDRELIAELIRWEDITLHF